MPPTDKKNRRPRAARLSRWGAGDAQLQPEWFRPQPCDMDGNCLYHATGRQLGVTHVQLRQQVADQLAEPAFQSMFVPLLSGTWLEYVQQVRRPGTWGGEREVRTISELHHVRIVVVQDAGRPVQNRQVSQFGHKDWPIIFVSYVNNAHYEVLQPLPAFQAAVAAWAEQHVSLPR